MNLTEKILKSHLLEGEYKDGATIGIRIDQTLTQDATGTMAFLQFEAIGLAKVQTELSVSYVDHNTVQMGFENSDDHIYLADVASKHGVLYSRCGNGICHQVHLERFARPGKTLIGSDSHTPTAGGITGFSCGAGGIDVAAAMAGAPYYIQVPKVVNIELSGTLPPWTAAKDIILKVLSILTTKGNVGTVIEYSGDALKHLTVPERATITNMGAELGVTTSLFPSDEQTLKFLKAQGRESDFIELKPDNDAKYHKTIKINLSELVPLTAGPHSPDNIMTVASLAGTKVAQVCIGSCTNSSFKDIETVAKMLKGKTVHNDVSLVVVPGSRQVLEMAAKSGALETLINAGARVVEPSCSFCIGMGQSPKSNSISVRTNNRNFEGRSGTKDAKIYLVSPEVAALIALQGEFVDPLKFDRPPSIKMPEKFLINDNMIVKPAKDGEKVEIRRGPNIGEPPVISAYPKNLKAKVAIVVGDKITTDHIIPAGQRMKFRSNIKTYSKYVFETVDPAFHDRCNKNTKEGFNNAIVAGLSYGQGSSREHAAMCPAYLGVRTVIAASIERIHFANLINFGILPLIFEEGTAKPDAGDVIVVENIGEKIVKDKKISVRNETKGNNFNVICDLSDRQRKIVLAGGLLNFIKGGMA